MSVTKIKSFWNESWILIETKAPTKGCEYFFSNYGRMKSVNKLTEAERLLEGSKDQYGFKKLSLTLKDNVRQQFFLHKLVAEQFLETPDEEHKFLMHLDNDKKNNFFKNLKWVTQEELTARQVELGIFKLENKKRAKHIVMTESKVALLKRRLIEGKTKRKILARQFNITETQLRRIERGENWGHVKPLGEDE